jgi:phosphate-selective porin OprO and OprP
MLKLIAAAMVLVFSSASGVSAASTPPLPDAAEEATATGADAATQPEMAATNAPGPMTGETRDRQNPELDSPAAPVDQVDPLDPLKDDKKDRDPIADADKRGLYLVWKQHPSIRYGSLFRLDFQARLQGDAHGSYPAAPGLDCPNASTSSPCAWELRRKRVGIQGHLFKRIEFEVERELTDQELTERDLSVGYTAKSPWKDAYVNLSYIDDFQVQLGRFKIPFGLDELTSDLDDDFTYRSLGAIYLAPSRDSGVMVHGRFFKRGVSYWAGIFRQDGDNARSKRINGGNETIAVRVTGTPFRRLTPPAFGVLEIGTAVAVSRLPGDLVEPNGLRGRTTVTQDVFFEPMYTKGRRHRWEVDLDWTAGPASVRTEYTRATDDRLQQGLGSQDLPDARAQSWYVSGSWVLTGEPKTRPVKAAREFLKDGWGAVEVAGRFERLWFDSVAAPGTRAAQRTPRAEHISPSGVRVLTVGVNWIVNRWITLQVNALREQVEDPERNPLANGGALWSRVVRFQIAL